MKRILLLLIIASLLIPMACQEDVPLEKFTVYQDADGDGFGNPQVSMEVVKEEDGYVDDNTDCDDENASVNPDAAEIPDNEVDENCDGQKSDTWYKDSDGDGFGDSENMEESAEQPDGYVSNDEDCDDENASINPDAEEVPDNDVDENCDGEKDYTWYEDSDGDGYGNSAVSLVAPAQPTGYVLDNTDCNDQNGEVNPGATEVNGDGGLDNNCDGMILTSCADGVVEGDEECDDGNTSTGDGCGEFCFIEVGWECELNPNGISICTQLDSDGDGIPDEDEVPGCEQLSDCDGDGTPDGSEIPGCETNPRC